MEEEFHRIMNDVMRLPDEIPLVPNWPKDYTLHDACACGNVVATANILFKIMNDPYSDSSDSDSDDEDRIMRYVNDTDQVGRTSLHWACMCEDEQCSNECVRLLVEAGVRVDLGDDNDDCPVHLCRHAGGINILAEQKVDLGMLDRRARTPLMRAAERGNTSVVNFLVSEPWLSLARVNDIDVSGQTALIIACEKGYQQIVALLLPHVSLSKGSPPPIIVATKNQHVEIIRLIATRGPKALMVTDENGWSALHWASDMGNLEAVEELRALSPALMPIFGPLDPNINSKATDHEETTQRVSLIPTPLDFAIARGHLHVVKCFMDSGSQDTRFQYGQSVAVAQGYTGSQYGVYATWSAALKVLEGEAGELPPFAKRVANFRMFAAKDWEAAEQYVELRSYAKKRDEAIVARLELERVAAEQEFLRKAEAKRLKAERKAAKKLEKDQKKRLEGGKVGRRKGGRRGRRSKSPDKRSKSPEKRGRRGRSSKSPDKRSKSPEKRGRRGRSSKSPDKRESDASTVEIIKKVSKKRERRQRKSKSPTNTCTVVPGVEAGQHSQSFLGLHAKTDESDLSDFGKK